MKTDTLTRFGAYPEDWRRLDALGIGTDLLPVVSNPHAEISPNSSMKQLGKTPSRYDRNRKVVGIPQWTQHQASDDEIARWATEPDYGICIQTRRMRGGDADVTDEIEALAIANVFRKHLGAGAPCRVRGNSTKCLFPFIVEGDLPKRVIRVSSGMIEFLGNGQQFVAFGTHPSGARYEWRDSLQHVPELTVEQFEALWSELEDQFATEPSRTSAKTSASSNRGEHLDVEDPVADWLEQNGHVLSETRRGLVIECPWSDEHTGGETGDTSTLWLTAGTGGRDTGHFRCQHAHCEHRNRSDFLAKVGYQENTADDFEDLGPDPELSEGLEQEEEAGETVSPNPFRLLSVTEFLSRPRPTWLVKGLIPKADLGVIYGASGAGKSFIVLDITMAIARGIPWRGMRVRQGKVIYICAEGVGGFRNRVEAYCQHHGIDAGTIPLLVLDAVPNLLDVKQVKQLTAAIEQEPDVALVICDTFAQMTPGANENAGEDMGKAIGHVRHVGRKVGAVTILVHHAGKDAAKGARGWSGIRAAADFEMEVTRDGEDRALNTTKQKDADDQASWGFRLEQVIIALDEDGDDIKSAVVLESDAQVAAGVAGGRRRGKGPAAVVRDGQWDPVIINTFQELAVGGDVLKTELILRTAEKRSEEEAGSLRDRKKNVRRALTRMSRGNAATFITSEEDGYVTLVR